MYYTCKMYKDYFNHGTIAQKQPPKVFCKKGKMFCFMPNYMCASFCGLSYCG